MITSVEKTIAVVGAGVSGLAAAWKAAQLQPRARVILLEASDRVGGILQSERSNGYLIEQSADMFTTEPDDALQLCRKLGREPELVRTLPVDQRACVATAEGVEPVPRGFSLMLPGDLQAIKKSRLLDEAGVERLLAEESIPARREVADEDFESFVVRRFGRQAFERLVQPLVSGIYTADPQRLSMLATMKRFVEMEQTHGSLIAAARTSAAESSDRQASGARYDLFRAPADGMGCLPQWLLEAINAMPNADVRLQSPVKSIERRSDDWLLFSNDASRQPLIADSVILATPPAVASRQLQGNDSPLADQLGGIEAASCAVAVLAFDRTQLRRAFGGYGIVVPAYLQRKLIAASFSSNKFPGRSPDGKVLIRCFFGGALQPELVDLADDQLVQLAIDELDLLVGVDGTPELDRVFRWRRAMPQYHVGHLDRMAAIEQSVTALPHLQLAGNGYRGVGVPVCLASGIQAAEKTE